MLIYTCPSFIGKNIFPLIRDIGNDGIPKMIKLSITGCSAKKRTFLKRSNPILVFAAWDTETKDGERSISEMKMGAKAYQ